MDEPGGCNHGHGTFTAGIIHLVAPDAKMIAYRVATPGGRCNGFVLAKAMLQAILDGCHVINLTFAMHKESGHHAMENVVEYAKHNNVVVVAGAGNTGDATLFLSLFPASDENVIAVAATNEDKELAGFSHYGEHIDVCAPGVDIQSAFIDNGYTTATWSGTCFAASIVSGQVALIMSRYSDVYTWSSVRNLILNTAEDLDKLNPGFAGMLGEGHVNPVASLSSLVWPDSFHFEIVEGCSESDTGCAHVLFPGDPTPISASVTGEPQFAFLLRDPGDAGEVCFQIDAGALPTGQYHNDLQVEIQGIASDSIVEVPISLTVQPHDTTFVSPDTLFFSALAGDCSMQYGESYLTSSNAPAYFSGWVGPSHEFIIVKFDTTGYTNDIVGVHISPCRLDIGMHYATVYYDVEGFDHYVPLTVCLEIDNPRSKAKISRGALDSRFTAAALGRDIAARSYPNPFNPSTTICCDLAISTHVKLEVFNLLGQRVATLLDEFKDAGRYQIEWNGKSDMGADVSSGIYFYRITAGSSVASEKMLLLR
jgi:hypothetical protein